MTDDLIARLRANPTLRSTIFEEALRAENARLMKLLSDTNTYYAECIAEREDLKQETAELKRAVKTAVFADSAELKDCKAENAKLQHVLKLALEYWAHRQQRYKNRHPAWVIVARAMMEDAE